MFLDTSTTQDFVETFNVAPLAFIYVLFFTSNQQSYVRLTSSILFYRFISRFQ